MKKILLRLPAIMIAGFIWFLSSQSTLPQVQGPLSWDKLQHVFAYAVLGGAIGLWASPDFWMRRTKTALFFTALTGSIYGAIDEIHQSFVPGRNANILDWAADTIGSILGAFTIMVIMKIIVYKNIKKPFYLENSG